MAEMQLFSDSDSDDGSETAFQSTMVLKSNQSTLTRGSTSNDEEEEEDNEEKIRQLQRQLAALKTKKGSKNHRDRQKTK